MNLNIDDNIVVNVFGLPDLSHPSLCASGNKQIYLQSVKINSIRSNIAQGNYEIGLIDPIIIIGSFHPFFIDENYEYKFVARIHNFDGNGILQIKYKHNPHIPYGAFRATIKKYL